MKEDEYDLLISDPMRCIAERILPRMYNNLALPAPLDALTMIRAKDFSSNVLGDFYSRTYDVEVKNGAPNMYGCIFFAPFDLLADHLRGVGATLTDMRRRPEKVKAACEVLADLLIRYIRATFPVPEEGFPFACCWAHMAPFMNEKQFDQLYFPTFKRVCDTLAADGYSIFIQFQGNYGDGRLFDRYAELPSQHTILAVEQSAPGAIERILGPTHCITGSLPFGALTDAGAPTLERTIRDTLERGMACKRFIFDFGKPPLTKNDAPLEQLETMCRLVRTYGKY